MCGRTCEAFNVYLHLHAKSPVTSADDGADVTSLAACVQKDSAAAQTLV